MAIHWQIPFKSLNETSYVVNIYDDDYAGDPVTLKGAEVPFETQDEDGTDPFLPIRTQSGYIRVINEGNTDGITPNTSSARYVTLVSSEQIVWQGYLSAESFTQDWNATPYMIELPVVSPLSLLDTQEMDYRLGLYSMTIGKLIGNMFVQMGFRDLYDNIYIDVFGDVERVLSWEVSRFNWFEVNKAEDDGTGDWKGFIGKTYKELMEDILKFFGLCMIENGTSIYLKALTAIHAQDKGEQQYMGISFNDFIAENYNFTQYTSFPLDSSSIMIKGVSHHQDIASGYRKITLEANTNTINDLIGDLDVTNHRIINTHFIYKSKWLSPSGESDAFFFAKFRLRENANVTDDYKVYVYGDADCQTEAPYPSEYSEAVNGCVLTDLDVYNRDDIDAGKKNFAYDTGILCHTSLMITGEGITPTTTPRYGWGERVGFTLTSKERAYYKNGYLCLSIDSQTYDALLVARVNGLGHMIIGLRVGDKYWNGSSWQSSPSTFYVKFGNEGASAWDDQGAGKTFDTKTLAMDCNGASGYIIPVNTPLNGDIELQFICAWSYIGGYDSSRGLPHYMSIKSLKIEYYSPDTEATSEKKVNIYAKATGADFPEENQVRLNIASFKDNKKGYGILSYNGSNVEKGYFNVNGIRKLIRPEEYLLETMAGFYAKSKKSITIETERNDSFTPSKRINYNGKTYFIASESINWRDDKTELTLTEL